MKYIQYMETDALKSEEIHKKFGIFSNSLEEFWSINYVSQDLIIEKHMIKNND